jgi:serine protease Do
MFFRGARLGISVETLTDQLAEYFGVKDGHGVLVTEVRENTPAAKAGLKAGDIITAIDDQKVDDVSSLTGPLNKKEEGAVKLTIMRDRNQQTITVTLEKRETRPVTPRRVRLVTSAATAD